MHYAGPASLIFESPVPARDRGSWARGGGSRGGGDSWERDTGDRLGSGSEQFWPASEAQRGDSEPGQQALGASHSTRQARPPQPSGRAYGPAGQASGQHGRGQDRSLSPAGLRLATSESDRATTLTVAVRSGRRSRPGRACLAREGGVTPLAS